MRSGRLIYFRSTGRKVFVAVPNKTEASADPILEPKRDQGNEW